MEQVSQKLPRPTNLSKLSGKKMFEMLGMTRAEQKVIVKAADIVYKRYELGGYRVTYLTLKSNEPTLISDARAAMRKECRDWPIFIQRCADDDEWITDVLWNIKTRHILDRYDADALKENEAWKERDSAEAESVQEGFAEQ